jgi:hypothetical protein
MQYTQQHKEMAKKFLRNENVNFEHDVDTNKYTDGTTSKEQTVRFDIDVGERIWTDGTSIWSETKAVKGVKVDGLSLIATKSEHSDDDDYVREWSGGLAGSCYYDGSGKDGTWCDGEEYSIEEKGGFVNGIKKEGTGDGYIYTDDGFTSNLEKYLTEKCDFDKALFAYLSFDYSEQGMQDAGCVNFDVEMDADFWIAVKEEMELEDDKLRAKAAC